MFRKIDCLLFFFISFPALSQQKTCYSLFEEARQIVQEIGIKTLSEYQDMYKELQELGLPRSPSIFYKKDGWRGWKDFLGENFQTYKEIQEIAQKAGIKTEAEYKKVYSKLGLPSYPDIIYEEEWPGWKKFLVKEKKKRAQNTKKSLGRRVVRTNFPSFEEAKQLAQSAGIKTNIEYKLSYKELGLPSNPHLIYKDQWSGWREFLGKSFPSFEKAKEIAQGAGIKTKLEYREGYKKLGLPHQPAITYKDQGWGGYGDFLGTGRIRRTNFPSFEKAKKIAQEAGIKTRSEYRDKYKELGLPASPHRIYRDQGWIDFRDFLGKKRIRYPIFLQEAKQIVQDSWIKSILEYKLSYKELGLPSNPDQTYKFEWKGWNDFLGKERIYFPSFEEAKQIAQEAGIKTKSEYRERYRELALPSKPESIYKDQGWQGWRDFLGTGRIHRTNFPSFEEAKEIVQGAGIKTRLEYRGKYNELGLPSSPHRTYKAQGWRGFGDFLGTGRIRRTNFLNFEEAKQIVQEAWILSILEYKLRYKELGLPSSPDETYKFEWESWNDFLGKERISFPDFEEAKEIAQTAGIKTKSEYRKRHKELGLPSSPNVTYKDQGWRGFNDFLGTGKEAQQT